jgi:hypothetical protein
MFVRLALLLLLFFCNESYSQRLSYTIGENEVIRLFIFEKRFIPQKLQQSYRIQIDSSGNCYYQRSVLFVKKPGVHAILPDSTRLHFFYKVASIPWHKLKKYQKPSLDARETVLIEVYTSTGIQKLRFPGTRTVPKLMNLEKVIERIIASTAWSNVVDTTK